MANWQRTKRMAIAIAVIGLLTEIAALALLAGHRLPAAIATPLIIAGMLLAFIPMFVVARRAKRR